MWEIKYLSGPQAGKTIQMKSGKYILGRGPHCDVIFNHPGVSKEHCEISVTSTKVIFKDLGSTNGTFLNGTKLASGASGELISGDQLMLHDLVIGFKLQLNLPSKNKKTSKNGMVKSGIQQPAFSGNSAQLAASSEAQTSAPAAAYEEPKNPILKLIQKIDEKIESSALPAIYKLAEYLDFRTILIGFCVVFIFVSTLLSVIPMVSITKSSILAESKRRALSLARTVATLNQTALLQNNYTALSTQNAETEEGVEEVFILQQSDGLILSPASKAGRTPDLPFVHRARRESKATVEQIDSSTIGASYPIGSYDPATGELQIKAHAVIIYDIKALSFDDGQVLSLFLQTLVLSSVIGLIIFYMMVKLIEYPFQQMAQQFDQALREKTDNAQIRFQYPPLQKLLSTVNSLLTRLWHGDGSSGQQFDKQQEINMLTQMFTFPAFAVQPDGSIITANQALTYLLQQEHQNILLQNVEIFSDQSTIELLRGLIQKVLADSMNLQQEQTTIAGQNAYIVAQGIHKEDGQVQFVLFSIVPQDGGST